MAHDVATEIIALATCQHKQDQAEAELERKQSLYGWQNRVSIDHTYITPYGPVIRHENCAVHAEFSHDGQGLMRWSFMGAKPMLTDTGTAINNMVNLLTHTHRHSYQDCSFRPLDLRSLQIRLVAGKKRARGGGWSFAVCNTLVPRLVAIRRDAEPGAQVDMLDLKVGLEEMLALGMSARVDDA
jgi:hypothetical protein